jgi:hypothetical protein
MVEVTPFIKTIGTEKFKEFLSRPFTVDMLYPVFNEKSVPTLFEGWRGKDMLNWYRFVNDEHVLEIYADRIIIKRAKNAAGYEFHFPKTIDSFINLMNMFGVDLYWTSWIDENFEPKDYLHKDNIKQYYIDLLAKLDKSNELQ